MLSSVVRNRKCSHGFFKSICKQCKQAGVRGGGSQLCKHFVRRSYCTTCSPGMQRCKLHPEKTKALCLKCAHLKGHGSSLCRCVYLRCTHAYTHSPHTYSILSLLSLCSLSLSLSPPPSLPPFLPPSSALSLSPSVLLTSQELATRHAHMHTRSHPHTHTHTHTHTYMQRAALNHGITSLPNVSLNAPTHTHTTHTHTHTPHTHTHIHTNTHTHTHTH